MQKLHLVGFTPDFDGLIFSVRKGAKSGGFVVPLDGRLLKEIADAERRRDGEPGRREDNRLSSPRLVRPESALNPREMQDRIRSGWTLDEVAAEAGVDLDWVSRFAAPVLAEVARVVEQARAVVFDKPRVGASSLPLGASVRRNVLERGVRVADEDLDDWWSAYQLGDDVWVVRFTYTSRGRPQEAEWVFDVGTRELTSRNRLASQLGHWARARVRVAVEPAVPKPKPRPSPSRARPRPAATGARPVAAVKATGAGAVVKAAKAATTPRPPGAAKAARPAKAVAAVKAPSTKSPRSAKGAVPARATRSAKAPTAVRATKASRATKGAGPVTAAAVGRTTKASRVAKGGVPAKRATRAEAVVPTPAKRATRAEAVVPTPAKRASPKRAQAVRAPKAAKARVRSGGASDGTLPPPAVDAESPTPIDTGAAARPGPLSPPGPAAVAPARRAAAASPIGEAATPPRAGAAGVDPVTGIARIDSRRVSRHVPVPPPPGRAAGGGQPGQDTASTRRRRTEPLRGR